MHTHNSEYHNSQITVTEIWKLGNVAYFVEFPKLGKKKHLIRITKYYFKDSSSWSNICGFF